MKMKMYEGHKNLVKYSFSLFFSVVVTTINIHKQSYACHYHQYKSRSSFFSVRLLSLVFSVLTTMKESEKKFKKKRILFSFQPAKCHRWQRKKKMNISYIYIQERKWLCIFNKILDQYFEKQIFVLMKPIKFNNNFEMNVVVRFILSELFLLKMF